jgi:hypothetical protein
MNIMQWASSIAERPARRAAAPAAVAVRPLAAVVVQPVAAQLAVAAAARRRRPFRAANGRVRLLRLVARAVSRTTFRQKAT